MNWMPVRGRGRWCVERGHINRIGLAVLVSLVLGSPRPATAQAPDEDWRTITTEHFRVTFPVELEALGRRAAERAEWSYDVLAETLVEPPEELIDVLVTDHTDRSNGFAQLFPSNRITLIARPPTDGLSLGYFDEWIELVMLHELAHIVHLDEVNNPLGRLARAVFGRVSSEWPFFPETATPRWVIEGLATWYESRHTGAGRVNGTYQDMQLRTALLEGRFEGIDQASGESPLWPGGNRAYTYGAQFFAYLLDKHGAERMTDFVEAVGGQWIPFRLNAAGKDAFGVSLSAEWSAWRAGLTEANADLDARLSRHGPVTEPERLTVDARWGWYPQLSPDGRTLAYARSDGRSDIQLRVSAADGSAARQLTRTNGLSNFDWTPDGAILLSQLELDGPYRSYGDLYLVTLEGEARRVTRRARLGDPSVAPAGGTAVAVQHGGGTNGLVLVDLVDGSVAPLVAPEPDVHWAFPSFSPDGRWIAATRWEPNAFSDLVVLDAATGRVVHRVTEDRAVDQAPAWAPDGRTLVWASDRTGIPNIVGATVDPATGRVGRPMLLTNVRTGATFPSIDPSGQWLYFSGYHVDGWEVERIPFAPGSAAVAPDPAPRFSAPPSRARGISTAPMESYSPGPTLQPKYWEISYRDPIVFPTRTTTGGDVLRRREALGYALGFQTGGLDLVGRHSYSLYARLFTEKAKLDAGFGYIFSGFGNPLLSVSVLQRYDDAGQLLAGTAQDTLFVLERERELEGAVTFLAPSWRHDLALTLGAGLVWENRELLDRRLERTRAFTLTRPGSKLSELAASITFSTARSHSFQMGMTRGVNLFVQGRVLNELALPDSLVAAEGVDRSLGDLRGRARAAIPLWTTGRTTHVLALQATGGAATGPGAGPVHFTVGGASGRSESVTGAELFGGSFLFFPVRGYSRASRFGRYAWSASAEYRFPLFLPNRGLGAWPLHFDQVIGTLFLDAGNAWGPDIWPTGATNPLRSAISSIGAEVTTELLALYDVTTRIRTGIALPLVDGSGAAFYVRVGLPF